MMAPIFLLRAIKHLLDILKPYTQDNGGPIKVEHITFVEGRGNLILEYCPEGASGAVVFMGSHLDVVPANPETWERNPFKLTVEVQYIQCPDQTLRLYTSISIPVPLLM